MWGGSDQYRGSIVLLAKRLAAALLIAIVSSSSVHTGGLHPTSSLPHQESPRSLGGGQPEGQGTGASSSWDRDYPSLVGPRRRLLQVALGSFTVKDGPRVSVQNPSVTAYTCQEVCELLYKSDNPGFMTYAGSTSVSTVTSTCYGDRYIP